MPKRTDIRKILLIGSGPIVIGQGCEFDYSGTQACRVLREEGVRVILVNSNPATIMTDPGVADATYVEPITPEIVESIIAKERPDAVLATLGGQTALNTAIALHEAGVLERYGCPLIGADVRRASLRTCLTIPVRRRVRGGNAMVDGDGRACRQVQVTRGGIHEEARDGVGDVVVQDCLCALALADGAIRQVVGDVYVHRARIAVLDGVGVRP